VRVGITKGDHVASQSTGITKTPVRGDMRLSGVMWFAMRLSPELTEHSEPGQLPEDTLAE
jgi:hypothetical protein